MPQYLNLILPQTRNAIKSLFGNVGIYQRFQHSCGFLGNAYHLVDGKAVLRDECPKCHVKLVRITLAEHFERIFKSHETSS